jgi:FO synthase
VGIPTTSTMMYGLVDNARHWVTHLRVLSRIQDETGGFTEFVPLPFVHTSAPIYLAGATPRPHEARQLGRARDGAHPAPRPDRQHPDELGQARCRRHPGDAPGRRQRPRQHADGGHHPDGRLRARLGEDVAGLTEIGAGIGRPARERTTLYE